MKDFKGKNAFITGGASGIGLGIARALIARGMNVVIADLRPDHIEKTLADFAARGERARVHAIELDVTDRAAMAAAAAETSRVFGPLHVLVNNAGVGVTGPLAQATYADWDFGLGVNLGGVVNGLQSFLPGMRSHGQGGHIVNTASLAAMVVMPPTMVMYVAAKAAVIALSESYRLELEPENIGVTVLCPGPVKSNIQELAQNRPQKFRAGSGFGAAEAELGKRKVSDLWMEPDEVGRRVARAIEQNELYLVTHGEWRPMAEARFNAMLAAMPTEVNPELVASMRPKSDS
ncbi:MAG TPA: SDR family NAD(P)-dependent oxidoreductase [Steroidobacteraceae bacterium]|nr:SDR family NAD(P)-dependent oxidoreductase [Steroidobacteraceae bacterium]